MRQRLIVKCDGRAIDRDAEARRRARAAAAPTARRTARRGAGVRARSRRAPRSTERSARAPASSLCFLRFATTGSSRWRPSRFAAHDVASGQIRQRGFGRRADRRAELHQALVEIAGRGRRGERGHQLAGPRPQRALPGGRLDVVGDRVDAGEHARDVAVDERRPLAERDRGDRARGVRADAGHLAELCRAPRELAAEPRVDRLRSGVQVARARVVAEAGPRGEHVVERRAGERPHRREPRHPPLPVRDHGRDAGLLQHDLADPDRVRIAGAPPRQIAADLRVMIDHRSRDPLAHDRSYTASCHSALMSQNRQLTPPSIVRTTTASWPTCGSAFSTRR